LNNVPLLIVCFVLEQIG